MLICRRVGERLTEEGVITPNVEESTEAILQCAAKPRRDVFVGGPARLTAILETFFPRVKDIYTESLMKSLRPGENLPSKQE